MTRASLVLWLLLALPAPAATVAERAQALLRAQAAQPITVNANRAEWRSDGVMIYEGRVRLTSGALSLEGDRVELRSLEHDEIVAQVSGSPARLVHAAQQQSPQVSAESRTLILDSRAGLVQLSGDARLRRGAETLAGDRLRYDVAARRILGAGRIRMEVPSSSLVPAPQP